MGIIMMGKTHIAVGIAAAYAITQPKTISEFVVAMVGGSIGGVMADIDVKIDKSNKYSLKASIDALYGEILAVAISVCALLGDYFAGGNILRRIVEEYQTTIIGMIMLAVFIVVGELSKHRDRTHSLLACAAFSFAAFLIDLHIGLAFAIGYGSHLVIDLFNKSPIRILYPLKRGICFKICYADRLGNELFLIAGICTIVLYSVVTSLL